MSGSTKHTLAALLILLGPSACDNVEWGGVEVGLESPPGVVDTTVAVEEVVEAAPTEPILPEGPTLFMGERLDDTRIRIRPIAEIGADSLLPLPRDRDRPGSTELFAGTVMAPGTAFTLFTEGVRVGTARVDSVTVQPGLCAPEPVATGILELRPEAAGVERFVVLRESVAGDRPYTPFQPPEHIYDQRVASINLATDAISQVGAAWPNSVLEMRADMQSVPLDGEPHGAFAVTFLYQDAIRVGESLTEAAYNLFILGEDTPSGYRTGYLDYRPVSAGKAAKRFFESADWDGDGETEILVEVFGAESRWVMALDRRNGTWFRAFEEACDPAAPPAP